MTNFTNGAQKNSLYIEEPKCLIGPIDLIQNGVPIFDTVTGATFKEVTGISWDNSEKFLLQALTLGRDIPLYRLCSCLNIVHKYL